MPTYFIYPIYTAALSFLLLALVPRQEIRRLAFYGIFFGALIDIILIVFINLTGIGGYMNYGPFGFLGIPLFPPIAWVAFFIIFLYFLPKEKPWDYIYVLGAAGYGTMFSNVLQNLGIFEWNYGNIVVPYVIYLSWFAFFTWAYYQLSDDIEQQKQVREETGITEVKHKTGLNIPTVKIPIPKLKLFKRNRVK